MRTKQLICVSVLALLSASTALADLVRLTPEGGVTRTQFRHLAMNDSGDYVVVSNSRVFTGNVHDRTFASIMDGDNISFVLSASAQLTTNGVTPVTVRADFDILGERVAINAGGDFVLASNSRLHIGNARTGQIQEVADAGRFTSFQQVAINDAGNYVAVTEEKLFAGTVGGTVATMIDEAVGTFEAFEIYAMTESFTGETGQDRLALNAAGQYVAITRSAVYGGSVTAGTITKLYEERRAWFTHVRLAHDGAFVTVTDRHVYAGQL